jgi:hypothetical protein
MAFTSQIRSSDATFKLAQRLVESLSERFGFSKDDAWNHVCSMSIEVINRKMRKERRRRNPTSQVKKPRTAFSFFTQQQRPLIQAKNPTAKFGELSRLVSIEWKNLSEAQMAEFKAKETTDRVRYTTEVAACKEKVANEAPAISVDAPASDVSSSPVSKAPRLPKAKKLAADATPVAPVPATSVAAPVAAPAKKSSGKATKAKNVSVAAPVAEPVAAPVAEPVVATPVANSGSRKAKAVKA